MQLGRQACFGLEGDWQLTWCLDGRFYEHFNSEEMEFQYGFDGKESPWHADTGGHVSDLELDNLEVRWILYKRDNYSLKLNDVFTLGLPTSFMDKDRVLGY